MKYLGMTLNNPTFFFDENLSKAEKLAILFNVSIHCSVIYNKISTIK